jgi:pyrimidine-nucleoside phosphorylase
MQPIHPIDVIQHKRDGLALSDAEIQGFVRAMVARGEPGDAPADAPSGSPTDAQIAALLMAIFLRGLDARELAALTQAMRFSGETLDTSSLGGFAVDKHSTGGVGDKTSLLIAPMVAAAGVMEGGVRLFDPMISGRSLGHTGGTLDKLETIPGFRTQLGMEEFLAIVRECGFAMAGQTPSLVPADRILYALRDHTGTVESPYLITASIMSKKLAAGLNGLVLDVKTGSGAFMSREEDARLLARLMVETGERAGTRTVALLTSMDQPLGRFAGNWVEVMECVEIFQHYSPEREFRLTEERLRLSADLVELTCALAGWMIHLGGRAATPEAGAKVAEGTLRDGSAYERFLRMVRMQSEDVAGAMAALAEPGAFHKPRATRVVRAERAGYLAGMDCAQVGWAVQRLGAGRARPGDAVSAHAGIEMHVKIGDRVEAGQALVTLFSEDEGLLEEPAGMVRETLQIAEQPPASISLIREVIRKGATHLTPEKAVAVGTFVVNLPVLAIMIGGFVVSSWLLHGWVALIGSIASIAVAWLYWSLTVPRWRLWAMRSGADAELTQILAQRAGLVWKRGSMFEKTEIGSRKSG